MSSRVKPPWPDGIRSCCGVESAQANSSSTRASAVTRPNFSSRCSDAGGMDNNLSAEEDDCLPHKRFQDDTIFLMSDFVKSLYVEVVIIYLHKSCGDGLTIPRFSV